MNTRPTLLGSCASATTAAEARYRINAPVPGGRTTRIVALDDGAAAVTARISGARWDGARFFTLPAGEPLAAANGNGPDPLLCTSAGETTTLSEQLVGTDVMLMIATGRRGADTAAAIGEACTRRGIMTAAVILGDDGRTGPTITALRQHARVLVVSEDEDDVFELLTALRA